MWSTNCAEWALVQYATAKLGVILVNINPSYRVSELEYALGQSGCRWLSCAIRETRGSDFVEMVEQVRPRLPRPRAGRVLRHAPSGTSSPPAISRTATACARAMDELDFDEPINIQYTSGTTGFPKGATLTHHNILNNGHFVGRRCSATPSATACACRCRCTTASGW